MAQSADGAVGVGGDYRHRASQSAAGQPDEGRSGATVSRGRRWTPGDLWGSVQRLLGFGVMRVSSPLRKADPGDVVHARARVKSARISEWYFYKQEISENATRYREKTPKGRIKLVLLMTETGTSPGRPARTSTMLTAPVTRL